MAYLMVKYQGPTTYALVDLSEDQFELVVRGLGELRDLYERMEATAEQLAPITDLVKALERRYGDDVE